MQYIRSHQTIGSAVFSARVVPPPCRFRRRHRKPHRSRRVRVSAPRPPALAVAARHNSPRLPSALFVHFPPPPHPPRLHFFPRRRRSPCPSPRGAATEQPHVGRPHPRPRPAPSALPCSAPRPRAPRRPLDAPLRHWGSGGCWEVALARRWGAPPLVLSPLGGTVVFVPAAGAPRPRRGRRRRRGPPRRTPGQGGHARGGGRGDTVGGGGV